MTAMPDRHDGESLGVSHHGFHVGYARGVRELERWVDLGRAGGGLTAVSAPARVSGRPAAGICGPAPTPPHPAGNPGRAGRRWWSRGSGRSRFPPRRREDRAGKRGQRCCRGSRRDRKLAVSPLERGLAPSPGHGPVSSEVEDASAVHALVPGCREEHGPAMLASGEHVKRAERTSANNRNTADTERR